MGLDYELLFRSVPGLYLVLTPDLVMVESSDARLHATMTRREDIVGRPLFEVFGDDPNDPSANGVENLRASLERVLRERRPDAMAIQKYSLRRPPSEGGDFEQRFWSPVNVPVLDENGEVRHIIHRVEDVTEFVRAVADMQPDRTGVRRHPEELRRVRDHVAATVFRQAQDIQETNRQLRAANSALAAAHDVARRTEQRTREILDSIGDAFLALDDEWRFTYANSVVEEMWGVKREDIVGRPVFDVVPPLRGSEFESNALRTMRDRVAVAYEAPCVARPGLWMHARIFPTGHGVTAYMKDITARKLAEQARERSDAIVRLLGRVAIASNEAPTSDAAFQFAVHAVSTTLDWAVGHAFRVDGAARDSVVPMDCWYDARPQAHLDIPRATISFPLGLYHGLPGRVLATKKPVWVEDLTRADGYVRAEAARRVGLRAAVAVPVLVGSEVRAVLELFAAEPRQEDPAVIEALGQLGTQLGRVIEREESVAARQKLLERLVLAQEDERRRVSRELHDQMGQHLTALVLGVHALRKYCGNNAGALEKLDRLEDLADHVAAEARDLAVALRPTLLDDFGLASAIRTHVERWSADTRIPVILECSGLENQRLSSVVETAVYRIVLEALTNVARHADATRVNVILETFGTSMSAIVEDDGQGFHVGTAREGGRLGIVSMSERATLAGGSLVVESSPGDGTTIIARFPLAERDGCDGETTCTDGR